MVSVVLLLPPRHTEPLSDVPNDVSNRITPHPIGKHLMVQKIMGKPAALLPEQRQQDRAADMSEN
jgi:hypothetical protein